jgi:Kef-type K+ transport system membrane component KefB
MPFDDIIFCRPRSIRKGFYVRPVYKIWMPQYASEYFALALVAILAFMSPLLAKRIKVPVVVVELIFGMTIGGIVAILKWLKWSPPWEPAGSDILLFGAPFKFLANLGFIVLLFLAGLEFDFQILNERGKGSIFKAIGAFVLTFLMGTILMIPLGMGIGNGGIFLVGLTVSTTFVGIVATTLREVGLADMPYRQNIIIMALMADIAVTIMLVLVPLVAKADLLHLALNLGIYIPVTFLIFYIAYRLGSMAMWHFPKTLSRFFHGKDPSELGVRASFMFLFFFILLTLAFGIEAILGAFLAGMLFSLLFHEGALLSKKLFGLGYGFFVPVFFIYIGSNFDFTLLWRPELLWMVPYIIMVAVVNKMLPSIYFAPEHPLKKVLGIGVLNSSRLAVMIAAVTLGIQYNLVNKDILSPMILVAMVLCLVCPTAFKRMMANEPKEKGLEEARTPAKAEEPGGHQDERVTEEVL